MRITWRLFLVCSLALGTLSSCEEEFDPNADYKEIAVIYSLLDSSQPVQYAKVNKAFLNTKSNALFIAANNPDSTQFYNDITVELQKLNDPDSTVLATYTMHPDTVIDKEPGNFAYPNQVIYATDPDQVQLQGNEIYRIVVTNTATGKQYTAATRVVNTFCVTQVGYNTSGFTCSTPAENHDLQAYNFMHTKFRLAQRAEIYKAVYHLNFREFANDNDLIGTPKSVQFISINNREIPYNPITEYDERIEPNRLYEFMVRAIDTSQDTPETFRKMAPCKVVITAGGEELNDYIKVNNAYSAITQSRPEYTNIKNGTGLFSSRRTQTYNAFFPQRAQDTLRIAYPQLKFR